MGKRWDDKARKLDCGYVVANFKWKTKYGLCTVMEQGVSTVVKKYFRRVGLPCHLQDRWEWDGA